MTELEMMMKMLDRLGKYYEYREGDQGLFFNNVELYFDKNGNAIEMYYDG